MISQFTDLLANEINTGPYYVQQITGRELLFGSTLHYIGSRHNILTITDDINLNRMVIQVTLVIFGPVGFLAEVQLCHLYLHVEREL